MVPPTVGVGRYSPSTLAVHADDALGSYPDVAPAIHVSTTFKYSGEPSSLVPARDEDADLDNLPLVYSRVAAPTTSRFEAVLSSLTHGHAITYTSGLAAFFAMLTFLKPKVIAISGGYHGCHSVCDLHTKLHGLKKVDLWNEEEWDAADLGEGDIVHVETPINPTGEALNLADFRERASRRGAFLTVDSTFGPPGLQDPFLFGADVIMHSGTKYFGGHSDLLCGVLTTQRREWWEELWKERMYLGSVMGNLEGWLGLRSVRTLELRVRAQSRNAEMLVSWLDGHLREQSDDNEETAVVKLVVDKVFHASLQKGDAAWLSKQMPNGYGPVFAIHARTMDQARALPSKLHLFHHATSLGGVESLIEWRRMSDMTVNERLLRISVGVEAFDDLKRDLLEGFRSLIYDGAQQEAKEVPIVTGLPS